MILADLTGRVGSSGVEIPKRYGTSTLGPHEVSHHALAAIFRIAVRVDRITGAIFRNCVTVGFAIDDATAGKQKFSNIRPAHGAEQGQHAKQIVPIIFFRVLDRFPNIGKCRQMDHGDRSMAGYRI